MNSDTIKSARQSRASRLSDRLAGPGGLYNLGNGLGLAAGLWMQVLVAQETSLWGFFVGSPSAVALTLAMVVFFGSGECYFRAWRDPERPNLRLTTVGDWTSGIGALALGIGLWGLGQPVMALTAGLLHALGKFGSAWNWPGRAAFWRLLVPASRVPAILLLIRAAQGVTSVSEAIEVALLLLAYTLWCLADLMLWRPGLFRRSGR